MLHLFELCFSLLAAITLVTAQSLTSSDGGYAGYKLEIRDDTDSTVYETDDTDTSNGTVTSLSTPPDVFLNASVNVGELSLIHI